VADYYPLITKAVAGLDPDAPRKSRRALYERDHEEVSPTELVEASIERIEKHRMWPTIFETQAMPNPKSIML
jgi:hypothetical protein